MSIARSLLIRASRSPWLADQFRRRSFARRAVKVGRSVGGMLPVIDGLKDGESIVVSGSFILKAELGKGEAEHAH